MLWSSCRKDFDFEAAQSTQISFSTDTIFLDTLFNNIQSSTKLLTVRNNSNDDISISNVSLRRGASSKYQLNVDGLPNNLSETSEAASGKIFENVEILAKDSIFIFIEATIDPTVDDLDVENNYLDEIIFETEGDPRQVQLSTQVINAEFSFNENPTREFTTDQRNEKGNFIVIKGYDLNDDELNINRTKAQVIFGYAIVPTGKTMNISAGSRLHFSRDSGLIIEDGATLNIIGEDSPEDEENPFLNEVIIEGNQIDEDFDNLPAQWDFIWIQKGGKATLENTIIKNAITGLLVEGDNTETTPNLRLNNVQIYNSQTVGIQAKASTILGNNVVINQTGRSSINIEEGGNYNFTHSTFSNIFSFGTSLGAAISLNNSNSTESTVTTTDLNATFENCIIVGRRRNEITATNNPDAGFNINFENCLIDLSSNSNATDLDINNPSIFSNCIFNENPRFRNTNLNKLEISEESAANGLAKFITGNDIIGTERISPSDIGAYESIIFEKESN